MRQKYHNPHIRTSFPIEEHAASVLTPYAFDLLQHEIELSTKYAATEIDNDSYILRHHTKAEGGRLRRESSLIPKSSHVVNCNGGSSAKFQSLIRRLEVESSKTKEREEVATRELEKVIKEIIDMPESEELLIDLEPDIDANNDGCEVVNLIVTKSKGRPKGSRAKGSRPKEGVEAAKKLRHCHVPGCRATDHDTRNCPNKNKNIKVLPSQSPNKITKGWK
ncbi:hypothetical protein TSUD_100740 [Trifolium subterraneum]|uniref:Protein FAR1-RELATED SEQUENCE n=1 Tax=Trifolium subterraneum TaxID=3900 RepID=A0A2Z6PIG0_TRISU|nr:hypothetical protein TSUD_100740 [Trifolium subterraneum]